MSFLRRGPASSDRSEEPHPSAGTAEPRHQAIRLVEDPWTTIRHVVESVAIVAAGAWAFYTFFYQNDIKPAGEPPALREAVNVTRLGRDAKRDFIETSFGLRNAGKTEIDIAADAWDTWGVRYGTRARVRTTTSIVGTIKTPPMYRDSIPVASRHLITRFVDLRAAAQGGRPASIILEPGDEETLHDVIAVRRGTYDLIETRLIAVTVKTSQFGGKTGKRIHVAVIRQPDGGVFLESSTPGASEDDNSTDFALTP